MKNFLILFLLILTFSFNSQTGFKKEQLQFSRVKNAYQEKEASLMTLCKNKGIDYGKIELFIRAFKSEKEVELWARDDKNKKFALLKTYSICSTSGTIGPKRQRGDGQTPEGFYYIDRFNPQSNFYLSLGINYPNACDKIQCAKDPGGDIFIHGDCVTIGCIPLTDDYIKEVYILAVEAKDNGEAKIPVHIFPYRMSKPRAMSVAKNDNNEFWTNLKEGYDLFEKSHVPPTIDVLASGKYEFQ